MNLILESPAPVPYFTDVGLMLRSAGIEARNFDWFVSDVETNVSVPLLKEGARWLTGEELAGILAAEHLQFIWGVFSAVPRGVRPPVDTEPFADGNGTFWGSVEVKPQISGALFEVVCLDSTAAILIGVSPDQATAFRSNFPQARALSADR